MVNWNLLFNLSFPKIVDTISMVSCQILNLVFDFTFHNIPAKACQWNLVYLCTYVQLLLLHIPKNSLCEKILILPLVIFLASYQHTHIYCPLPLVLVLAQEEFCGVCNNFTTLLCMTSVQYCLSVLLYHTIIHFLFVLDWRLF